MIAFRRSRSLTIYEQRIVSEKLSGSSSLSMLVYEVAGTPDGASYPLIASERG
jgi:hypothetical protein